MNVDERVSAYANAFYEAAMERWLGALQRVAEQLEQNAGLRSRLAATDVGVQQRQQILDSLLPQDVDVPVRNFLYTILQRGDLPLLGSAIEALRQRMVRVDVVPTLVEVVSAVPLTDDQRQSLVANLERAHGANLNVRYQVDATILGGMIVRIGDQLIDGSVASRLAKMRQALGIETQ